MLSNVYNVIYHVLNVILHVFFNKILHVNMILHVFLTISCT